MGPSLTSTRPGRRQSGPPTHKNRPKDPNLPREGFLYTSTIEPQNKVSLKTGVGCLMSFELERGRSPQLSAERIGLSVF